MTIDSFSLVEHFDFMKRYIPQPFYIKSEDVKCIKKDEDQNSDDTIDFSHSVTMLSSASSSVKRFIMPTQTKTRTIRTRDMAAPRFGL